MPRRSIRRTDFETRVRNMLEIEGKHGIGGLSRLGGGLSGVSGLPVSAIRDEIDGGNLAASGSAQLLCMSATGDSIASGGDYVTFGSIVAQHGFSTVAGAGQSWTHPVSGVYLLTFEMEWGSYTGGGTVQLEVDAALVPEGVLMVGTTGQEGRGVVAYVAEEGQVGKIKVTQTSGSAHTCDAGVRIAITDPKTSLTSQPTGGDVVSAGTQASPAVGAWVGQPPGWVDTTAEWIWHADPLSRPDGEFSWMVGYYNSTTARAALVEASADNEFDLFLNGSAVVSGSDRAVRYSASVTLSAGSNQFAVVAQNVGGFGGGATPAGFLMSVSDATSGVVLFSTTVTGWFGFASQPVGWPTP